MLSTIESSFGNIEPPIQAHPVGAGKGFASRSLGKPLWFPKPKLPVSDVDPDPVGSGFIWVILLLNIKRCYENLVIILTWIRAGSGPGSGYDQSGSTSLLPMIFVHNDDFHPKCAAVPVSSMFHRPGGSDRPPRPRHALRSGSASPASCSPDQQPQPSR